MRILPSRYIVFSDSDNGSLLRSQPVTLSLILIAGITCIAALVAYAYFSAGIHPKLLLRDPNAIAAQPEYVGIISNAGIVGWIVTAAVTIYSYMLLQRRGAVPRYSWILLSGGLFTVFSGLDDLFMFHDGLAERMGIPQDAVLATYAAFGLVWLAVSAGRVFETEWLLLAFAMGGLGTSLALDLGLIPIPGEVFFEDMAKLLGITFWTTYFLRLSWRMTGPDGTSGNAGR